MRLYNKTFFSKASKVLADFNKAFHFEKFLIYVLPKFNRNFIQDSCPLYFYVGNLTQSVNNSKFFNVNNEFNVRNFLQHFLVN